MCELLFIYSEYYLAVEVPVIIDAVQYSLTLPFNHHHLTHSCIVPQLDDCTCVVSGTPVPRIHLFRQAVQRGCLAALDKSWMMVMMMHSFCMTLGVERDAFGPAWWTCMHREMEAALFAPTYHAASMYYPCLLMKRPVACCRYIPLSDIGLTSSYWTTHHSALKS
jgi:hypothetical protein